MGEMVFCPHCMEVTECFVKKEPGWTTWTCSVCGKVADDEIDDAYEEPSDD